MEEKIGVILVNYNGKDFNDKCIQSVLESEGAFDIEVVVVDNASTDGSLESLQENWGTHPRVHLIALEENYGFSKANNVGIRFAMERGIKDYLLLNNDTEIEPYTIGKMCACQKETGGIVVPKIYYADRQGEIWCAGGTISKILQKSSHRGIGQRDQGQFSKSGSCSFANGCCMLLTEEHIHRIGFLDERFFLYYEDNDYSLRAREQSVPIYYCGEGVVYHKVNGATKGNEKPASAYYITRNWLICSKRHMKNFRFALFCFYFALNRLAWAVIWTVQGKPGMVNALWQGITDFRRGITGKYHKNSCRKED